MKRDYIKEYSDAIETAKQTDHEAVFEHMYNGEIEKLGAKYFVLKSDDIGKFLSKEEMYQLHDLSTKISDGRKAEGKCDNAYVVLNLADRIDLKYLCLQIQKVIENRIFDRHEGTKKIESNVGDVAVGIVNAIIKTKNEET